MRSLGSLAAGLIIVSGCTGPTAPEPERPAPASGPSRAVELVGLLGHDDPGVRRDAESALSRMGEEAREALRAALDSMDAEVAARVRPLYRPLAASRLELTLGGPMKFGTDPDLYLTCFLRNGSEIPLVAVDARFYYQSRVVWSVGGEEGSPPVLKREWWRHGCSDVHPFEEKDFAVIPPGETRPVGWFMLQARLLPERRSRLVAKYVFKRPDWIDSRYFQDARLHQLYLDAVEVDGIVSKPIDIDVPARVPPRPR